MAKVKLENVLFGLLLQRPSTGYEIQQYMDTIGRFMRPNTSVTQVYRSLRAMGADGWLRHEVEPRLGAQDAKRYFVTAEGRAVFFDWLTQPYCPNPEPADAAFHIHLQLRGRYLGIDAAIDVLETEIDFLREQIARTRHRDRTEFYEPDAPIHVDLAVALISWAHVAGSAAMDRHVDACVDLLQRLRSGTYAEFAEPGLLSPIAQRPSRSRAHTLEGKF